jgi:hypothetical protein
MRIFFAFCIWTLSAVASPIDSLSLQSLNNREEALFLRRIADFWEEGEYKIAKNQMEDFLAQFSASPYSDTLRMTLGDLFLREKNFQEAINYYAQISNPTLADQVFLRRMECLYHLQWHATLADECEAYLQCKRETAVSKTKQEEEQSRLEATYLLAIALYEQCINPSKEESALQALAERAKPYFEILANSELSDEVSGALAHLRCILKDFQGASQIYLDLSKKADNPEELLFQAALIQSKYDKALALQTFEQIVGQKGKFASEASYNLLVLYFDLGRHEEIVSEKANWCATIPSAKTAFAHLFIGQSLLSLNRPIDAAAEFDAFLNLDVPIESIRSAFPHFVEAASRTNNLALLDRAILKWKQFDGNDPNLAGASFTRAQLLKKAGRLEEAKVEISSLLANFPQFVNRPQAAFNLIQLEADALRPAACREAALFFIQQYPSHELSPSAWRHLIAASTELSLESKELKAQLIQDLEYFLAHDDFLSTAENLDLQFHLAKTYFEIGAIQESLNLLEPLCDSEAGILFSEQPNAELLLALCFRDGQMNHELYCKWAESALAHDATLLSEADQHLALFNSYLICHPTAFDLMAKHLTASFSLHANIELPNLLWLANYTYEQFERDPSQAGLAKEIISHILSRKDLDPKNMKQETMVLEPFIVKYAKLLQHFQEGTEAIVWLESLDAQYRAASELSWNCVEETRLALGLALQDTGSLKLAEALFDEIASSTILRDRFAATAALQSARIKQTAPDRNLEQVLSMLKNISLQKTLANEPIHLEAALDYIELISSLQPSELQTEKSLDLLIKTKANFEAQDDLLSLDYHAARDKNAEQNQIYLDYMKYIHAKILLTKAELEQDAEQQKELKANAKEILLQITGQTSAYLQRRLEQLEVL